MDIEMTEPAREQSPIEDCVGWGLETTAETLIATEIGNGPDEAATRELCAPGLWPRPARAGPGPGQPAAA